VLVERLLVERRRRPPPEDVRIGALGLRVTPLHEQRLTAAKLRLVEMHGARVLGDQAIERSERLLDAPVGLVRTRELVKHEIVLRVRGIRREKLLVERDHVRERGAAPMHVGLRLLGLRALELEIREAAHRLGAQEKIVRRKNEELPIALPRLRLAIRDRAAPLDLHGTRLQRGDRAIDRFVAISPEGPDCGSDESDEQRRPTHGAPSTLGPLAAAVREAARS
jgi:hypothetical protein